MNYKPFKLEKWVSQYYTKKGIYYPDEIDIESICYDLGIILTYKEKRSFASVDENFKMINLDKRLPKKKTREHFFHELGHVLLHSGSQLILPKSFIELQEFYCQRFASYAAIPYHMIIKCDFGNPYLINILSNEFMVNEDVCKRRVEGIVRNCTMPMICVAEPAAIYNY